MRNSPILVVAALCLFNAAGCGGLSTESNQQLTSGWVGCPPEEISISGEQGHEIEYWVARCRGRTFHCVRGGGAIFQCSEDYVPTAGGESEPAPEPAPAPVAQPTGVPQEPPPPVQ